MNTIAAMTPQRRSRMQLILIAMLFAAPVVTAWVTWQFAVRDGVAATTNAGQLVQPARPLAQVPLMDVEGNPLPDSLLRGHWSYVLLAGSGCSSTLCGEQLYLTRQVRTGVSKDMQRVQRVLVVTQPPADLGAMRSTHPDLTIAVVDDQAWQAMSRQFGGNADIDSNTGQGVFFMVDPLGNLMMRYDASVPPKGVLKDLRKLLKVSQVG